MVLFQLIGNSTFSQEALEGRKFQIFDLSKKSIYKIDLENQTFQVLTSKFPSGPYHLNFENVKLEDIDQNIMTNSFKKSDHEFYVSISGTGQIYIFDVQKRNFKRLDKTFYKGYNFYSIPVFRKDTIYSFGGYGFWHINNVATFYDNSLNEWEITAQSNKKEAPGRIISQFGGYDSDQDKMFVAEIKEPYSENSEYPIPFFQFDFKNKKWLKLGIIKSLPVYFNQYDHLNLLWTGKYFFSNDFTRPHFIDPINNKLYRYVGNKKSFFALTNKLISKGSYLYSYLKLHNTTRGEILVDSIHVNNLIKDSVELGSFYEPISYLDHFNYYLLGIILLIVVLLFQFWEIRKHKISNTINNNGLTKSKELPEFSLEFLKFISSQENLICTTEELNSILNCSDKSIENQRQIRSKFISTLNSWIENEYQVTEAIARISSEYDKRFVNYTLSEQGLSVLKQILKAK